MALIRLFQPTLLGLLFLGHFASTGTGQGSIVTWKYDGAGLTPPAGDRFVQVDGTYQGFGALDMNGRVYSGGNDDYGQVSGTPTASGFIAVTAGGAHRAALRADGSIVSWGADDDGQVSAAPTGVGFRQVESGGRYVHALRSDGSIHSWGSDDQGNVSGTPTGTGFTHVEAGGWGVSMALRENGSLVAWGSPFGGVVSQTPVDTGFVQVSLGTLYAIALRSDGSITAWGAGGGHAVSQVPTGTGFLQIAANGGRGLALRQDGSIITWGQQLGPTPPTATGFIQISDGIALGRDFSGDAFCFGDGFEYQETLCPCSNYSDYGAGCPNSSYFNGAKLRASGIPSLQNDSLRLIVEGTPAHQTAFILQGPNQINGGNGFALGEGLLCIGGLLKFSQVQITGSRAVVFENVHGAGFGVASYGLGVPTNYQCWYRDPLNTCAGAGFNTSNAWAVSWTP